MWYGIFFSTFPLLVLVIRRYFCTSPKTSTKPPESLKSHNSNCPCITYPCPAVNMLRPSILSDHHDRDDDGGGTTYPTTRKIYFNELVWSLCTDSNNMLESFLFSVFFSQFYSFAVVFSCCFCSISCFFDSLVLFLHVIPNINYIAFLMFLCTEK